MLEMKRAVKIKISILIYMVQMFARLFLQAGTRKGWYINGSGTRI